ncbi:hypothetical protein EOD41_10055 [Mucilaginibacter limnophilus]|uniref:DUF6265 domain-containing protein n=1 Tax=Mucilaginibacter limnophilus TaxID=1932778 RepID=A0A437MTI2_9SPHI|nr:DUF6265 family protein [Mucilaginibacter limnophilus]RVU00966.1 hypothetical protein EOD41_10055 [Mucilaginibacter limnophilus]
MKYIWIIFILIAGNSVSTYAQDTVKKGSFKDISFIEGNWKASMPEGRIIEAVWLAPAEDSMLGMMRMMNGKKTDLYEILAYELTEKGLVSLVKHFKPGLLGQEEINNPNQYLFVEAGKNYAIFQNISGDLRILYEKRSMGKFAIARGNQENGKWIFKDLFVFNKE